MTTTISNSCSQLSILELNEQLSKCYIACSEIFTKPKHSERDLISVLFYRYEVGDVTLELEDRMFKNFGQYDTILAIRIKAIYMDLLFRWIAITVGVNIKLEYPDADAPASPECFSDPGTPEWYRWRPYIRLQAHESTFYPSDITAKETTLDPSLWKDECPCCLELLVTGITITPPCFHSHKIHARCLRNFSEMRCCICRQLMIR